MPNTHLTNNKGKITNAIKKLSSLKTLSRIILSIISALEFQRVGRDVREKGFLPNQIER